MWWKILFGAILVSKIQSRIPGIGNDDSAINTIVTTATNGILAVCEHRHLTINIIVPSNFSQNIRLRHALHGIVQQIAKSVSCSYQIKTANALKGTRMRFGVFLIDAGDYDEISQSITSSLFNFRKYFVVVLMSGSRRDIEDILSDMWTNKFIFNVNIVHCCHDMKAQVTTFMPFHDERCSDTTPVELFETDIFFPEKLNNLHKCPIIVATALDAEPCVYAKKDANGSIIPAGSDIDVIETLAQVLNFQAEYEFTKTQGFVEVDGSAEGPFKLLLEKKAHLACDCYWLTNTRANFMDHTSAYYNDYVILVVPPGKNLTPFEKLLYPFDWTVWTLLSSCMFFGLVIITAIKTYSNSKVRAAVFGERNASPAMNFLSVLLVGNQHIWPRKLFARLLLLNFLFFTLNMRTLYQGAMFELMHTNRKHDEMKSIDEVRDSGFPIYVLKTSYELFANNPNIKKRLVPVSSQLRGEIINKLEHSSAKASVIMARSKILSRNLLNKGDHQLTICKDRLVSVSVVMYAAKNFFLIDKINEKISLFSSAGLLQHWHSYDKIIPAIDNTQEPTVLNMYQLEGLFQLTLFGYMISICAYFCEKIWVACKKKCRRKQMKPKHK